MMFVSRDEATRILIRRGRIRKKNLERVSKESWEQYHEILKQKNQENR